MFRKKKENEEEGTEGGAVVRKTKSFKRIRGLLSAESRRKRRERRKAKKAGAAGSSTASSAPAADDQSTVYQVDVEDRSVMTSKSAAEDKKPYMLKVVLLLMDPETRRFELLQLEFDSMKALVSDVLAQIPLSVTEDALRGQHYTAICGRDGEAMTGEKLLANFCTGNDVLVAVPSSTTAKECARLAKPILSDDKVVSMVSPHNRVCLFLAATYCAHTFLLDAAPFVRYRLQGMGGKETQEEARTRSRSRRRPAQGVVGVDHDLAGGLWSLGRHFAPSLSSLHFGSHQTGSCGFTGHLVDQVWYSVPVAVL